MELKPGYKQTEVGVIPEDWEVCNLTDLSLKITDGDHLTPKRESSGYYLLSARNVLNGRVDVRDVDYVGHAEYQRMKQRCGPEAGDILISCSGTIGRVAVVPQGFECVLVRSAALAKIDKSLANGTFVQFWLQGRNAQSQISGSVNQGAQPNLFLNQIKRLKCPKPPLAEQLAIANVLSDLDRLLSDLDQLITKKLQVKQATMQELLNGKRRLPGFEGEWAQVSLGSVAAMNSGGTPPTGRDDFYGGEIPWVSISDMTSSGQFISETERTLSDLGLANCAAKRFPAGTILYAMYASLGECSIAAREVTTSQAILGIRPESSLLGEYLYYWLESIRGAVKLMGQQGTQSNLNKKIVQGFSLRLPSKPEQAAIAKVLCEIDQDIDALTAKSEKARAIKAGMMQQLLTGKIRLR